MSDRLPFLLEIGTEEIPDWMIEPALEGLQSLLQKLIDEKQLGGRVTRVDATPRRLTAWMEDLIARQADRTELVMGPPKAVAYKDGKPTGALLGFAKKMGVEPDALRVEATPKGEYLALDRSVPGQDTATVLAEALPALIAAIPFPKTMYWTGKGGVRFIRPIRWIVALLGDTVVPFQVADVTSGNQTQGHRQLGSGAITATQAGYETALRDAGVLISATERTQRIAEGIQQLASQNTLQVKQDANLLKTLTYLTEFPTPILGAFDEEFLTLPEEVLVTVMRHHQRYFSLQRSDGTLAPYFVAVTNTDADPEGLIRRGNERVLKARFKDARFFYDVDQHKKLEDRLDDLSHVTFQAKLGSYKEKTERNRELARELAPSFGVDPQAADRAAMLAKCDLTCEMVKEFTDLQGIVGGLYAEAQEETLLVAKAIYEHYLPLSMDGKIPPSRLGIVLSLADKLDTLSGSFAIDMIPSGSKDPFALRRAAQGVVKILAESGFTFPLMSFIRDKQMGKQNQEKLQEFFLDRISYYFREVRQFRYDEVNAVLGVGIDSLFDAKARLVAIQNLRQTQDFDSFLAGFKRIGNILKQTGESSFGQPDKNLFQLPIENELYEKSLAAANYVKERADKGDYANALLEFAELRSYIDRFFDTVLVNAPDERIRNNRLALLSVILSTPSQIADFSEIVTSAT